MNRPQRKFSQHFLNSTKFAERLVAAANIGQDVVIEIGPGKGSLTRILATRAKHVVAIEIDPQMVVELRVLSLPNVTIVHDDFLRHDITQYGRAVIVGNIPYAISSAIIENFITRHDCIKRAVVTVQREFARRLTARSNTKSYGFITLHINHYYSVKKLFTIPPRFFTPSPLVSSVVIGLDRRPPPFTCVDEKAFFDFVRAIFRYPRKSVKNAILEATGIKLLRASDTRMSQRPVALSEEDFFDLYSCFKRHEE